MVLLIIGFSIIAMTVAWIVWDYARSSRRTVLTVDPAFAAHLDTLAKGDTVDFGGNFEASLSFIRNAPTLTPEAEKRFLELRRQSDEFANQPLVEQSDEEFMRIIREANDRTRGSE